MSFGDTEPSEPRRGEALSGPPHLVPQVTFERGELDRILGLYGRKVAEGEWRDYAIDFLKDRAVFSVFRRASEIPIYRIEKFGFIHDLWVEPEYRHEGIGRQMTMLVIEKFREMGAPQIRLDTAAKNDAARALFASCGFRESTREMLLEL